MAKTKHADIAYAVWPTPWGSMGAVAGAGGIRRIVLPHYQADQLDQLLAWEHPGARRDEGPFECLVRLSRDYFNGRDVDFAPISCELPGGFAGTVLAACREIPYGGTRSYGWLAERIGRGEAARAAAAALGRNPVPLVVPCHRVTYADGRLGGFSAAGGVELKRRLGNLESSASHGQS